MPIEDVQENARRSNQEEHDTEECALGLRNASLLVVPTNNGVSMVRETISIIDGTKYYSIGEAN